MDEPMTAVPDNRPVDGVAVALALLGVFLVVAAAVLLSLAATYRFAGPPTCDGDVMSPGDICLTIDDDSDATDYDGMMRESQSNGVAFRALGGIASGGLGAGLLALAAVRIGNGDGARAIPLSQWTFATAAVLLSVTAAYLFTLGTNAATFGAVGAAVAAIGMVWATEWSPLFRVTTYAAGLLSFVGAVYLVAQAATYEYTGPLHGGGWEAPMDMLISDIFHKYGDEVRLVAAALAGCAGAVLVYASADPEWHKFAWAGPGSAHRIGTVSLLQYLAAAVVVAGTAVYLMTVGTVSAWIAVGFAAVLIIAFIQRGIAALRHRELARA